MRILIVTATPFEIAPAVANFGEGSARGLRLTAYRHAGHEIDVLTTGVGMVATAAWCSRVMTESRYELGLNLGVCGSFDRALGPGTVVHVVSDRLAELGAENDDGFLTLPELNLTGEDQQSFAAGEFVNAVPPANTALSGLPAVNAITVNTVHGNEQSIARVVDRCRPQVESMEGAAFMYACLIHELPFAQVRAVSNVVEKRNRQAWKLPEAIRSLSEAALRILERA
jgi:futalosine hydrolase